MKILQWTNHVIIVLFALSSGIYKVAGGQADVDVFAHLGMSKGIVALFGAVQALGGIGLVFSISSKCSAIVVALCNALATAGLFAAGVIPFGVISILFILMALFELKLGKSKVFAVPKGKETDLLDAR